MQPPIPSPSPTRQPLDWALALSTLLLLLLAGPAAWAQPSITGFLPTSGASGTNVVITGSNFTGATSVRFGELSAVFTVNSASQITAVVPRAASTQRINVTTSAGYAFSSAFTVTRGSSLSYSLVTSNFAGVNVSANASPAVADLDGDGLLDLLVGRGDGTISRYEQTAVNGTGFSNLGLLSTGSANIDMGTQATVAIVDVEGNGRYNLVLGRGDGTVSEYEQTSAGAATFALVQDNLSGISTTSNTATSMTDLDGDGDLELLVGKGDGITSHSEQNSVNTDSFYRIDTNFNALQLSGNAAPFCVDLDGNGRIDILMGVDGGTIYRYEQNAVGSFTVSQQSSNFNSIAAGSNAKPCVTDIDGDGLLDLLVGRGDGTISRYEQNGTVPAPTITSFTPTSGPVGTTVTVTGTNLAGASAVTVNGTAGTITGTPTATGFTFTVGTGSSTGTIGVTTPGGSASSSGSFTVSGSNTAPTALSLSPTAINENVAAGSTVGTFSTTDAQGGSFTYSLVTGTGSTDNGSFGISGGSLTINASPNYEVKPSYAIRVRTTDAGGLSFEQAFTITVNDVAEVPTVTSFSPTSGTVGTSGIVINGSNFTSAGAVTVYFNGTTATTVTVNSNSQLTATVPTGATTGTISVQNADGTGSSSSNFTVVTPATVTTAAPGTVTASSAVLGGSVTSGTALTERGVVYVAGNGTPTTGDTKALTGTSTGSFSGPVSGLAGNTLYTVRAYATNGAGTAYGAVQTFTTGNNPPVAVDDAYTVAEDSSPTPFTVLDNDTDPDAGTTLRVSAVTQPANGSVTFTASRVSFTPNANFNGSTSFTYTLADSNGGTDTGTVTVTVTAVNDAPVVTVPGTQTTPEDTPFAYSSGAGNAITVSDVDAGSGQLEIYLQATQGAISLSSTTGLTFSNGDGTNDASMTFRGTLSSINTALNNMAFYPNTGYSGAAALQVQANDLGNTGSGGALSNSRTVTINVTAVNDAPVLVASGGSTSFTAGSGAVAVDGGLTASDSDNTTLASGTVSVTTGFVSGQDVLAFSNTSSATFGNIAGSYASGTGVLSLTSSGATATVAQWQAALRAVTYNNTGTPPTGTSRVVSFRVSDGALTSNTATKTITLTVPAPVVTSLTPSSGPVGTSVVVAGSNFTGTTAVSFNGTAASSYVVNSSTQITAVVAAGTTTGPFTVTTPYGVSNNNGTFTVTAANTSTTLTSSANPSVFGQSVTFTATVTNTNGSATPTGTVTFKDGATTIGTGTLNGSGVATFSTSTLSVATHTISAVYGAATGFSASTSANLSQVVNAAGTTTTLTSSANPSVFGQGIYLNASVSTVAPGSGIATGTVTFKEGTTTLGTVAVAASGNASLLISTLSVGSHAIVATYAATTNYGASTSNTLTQVVNNAATSTTLASSVNPSTFGQSVTFTATVAVTSPGAGTVAGTVTFKDGSTTLGTGTLSGSTATFSTSALSQGSHSITAVYGGTTGLAASTSAVLTQVVNAPPAPAITSLSPTSGPVGTSVSISGSNLSGATSVSFDGVAQTTITGNTGTSLTVNVPAGVALGATDVVVTTPSGSSNTLTFTVTPPAPVVTSVAGPANGTYRIGQFVTFLVSFDQPVTVSTAGGTPVILMTVGSTPRGVTYLNGSNTNTLTFRYLVQAGDLDTDGVTLGNSIAPNNGTLRNATGTDVVPTLNNVSPLTGVLVDGVAPTATVTTTGANPTSSSLIPITITFSEAVTGLTAAGITVSNGTKGTLSGSGTTYTLNVTATASGPVTVQVNASAAQDAPGNPNAASNTLSVTYNPPPVSIASFTPTNGSVGTVVTITGSGFTGATAVTINNVAVASYTVDSNTQITATVSASNTTGLIRVTTGAGTGVSSTNFVVGPAITGVTATSNGTYRVGQTLTFSVTFSQTVTVVTTGGTPTVALTVGSTVRNVPYVSGSNTSTLQFRYGIVAGDLDTDGVTLSGTGIDLNGGTIRNSSAVNADLDFDNVADTSGLLVDGVSPTVTISSTAGSSTPTSPIPVTITFSEPVTGFTTAGITVTNGSKGTLSGSGTTYTINITPTAAGAVTVNVAANAAQDAATNGNVAAPTFSITYAPLPTITSFTPPNGPVGTSVTITGTNFTGATAVAFNGLAAASFTVSSATSITAVVPVGVTAGKISVTTPSGTVLSPSNFLPTSPAVLSVAVPANATYGVGQNLDFSVLYDQVVNVTGSPYLTLTVGSTARNVAYVSGSGSRTLLFRYVVAAGETDNNGVVLGGSINPGSGTIRNAGNSSATFTLNSVAPTTGVLVDGVVPTAALSSTASSPTNTSPIPLTITFSEPVTGLTLAALSVTNGTASNLSGSGRTYTVDITPAADGAVTVNLPAASAQDVAGNDNTAAPPFSITYAAPTVLISTLTPNSGPVGTGVTISGSNFTGATAVTFNGTAATFTVVSASSITTSVPAGASTGNVVVTAPIGTSNGVLFTVTLPGTSTTLVSSVNPATTGQAITFTATVAPAMGSVIPTGIVTFNDGATALGSGVLDASGVATFSTGSLSAGSHPITAVYGGSGTFAGSTSATLAQVVNAPAAPTITSLTPNTGAVGTSVTIAGSNLGGAISVSFDGTAQTTITAKSATSVTVAVPSGATTGLVTVTTPNGVSNGLTFTVTAAATSTTLASSANPSVFSQNVTFTATVSSGDTPTGTVAFKEGATTLGTGTLGASGVATFSTSTLSVGSHSITVVYTGNSNFATSTSAVFTQVVGTAGTSTTLASNSNPSTFGQGVTFTATVAATVPATGTPSGTVTFFDGSTALGSGSVGSGTAFYNTSALAVGSHSITAVYNGTGSYATSTSAVLTQVVNAPAAAAPIITSVTGPVNATYGIGAALNFSVSFDQPVMVTATPNLTVTVGNINYPAAYVSGSGSSTLVFRYTVAAGDLDTDGVMLDTSIDLNGGTIRNASGTDAVLVLHNVAPLTGVLVDGVAPTVAASTTAGSPTSNSPIPFTLTFSEPVTGLTLAGLAVTNGTASNLAGSGTTYTLSITPTAGGTVTLAVVANAAYDAAGNGNAAAPLGSIVYVVPPAPTITSLSAGAELPGMPVTITGTDFTSNSTVSFGSTMASSVTYNSATSLTVVVPAGAAAGNSTITVTTPAGSSTRAPSFAVLEVYNGAALDACATAVPVTSSINDGQWHYLLSATGQVVLAYNHSGSDLGDISVDVLRANSASPVRQDTYGHRYLDRNFHLTATNTFAGRTVQLRFYGLTSEFNRLQAADASLTYARLAVSQYSGPNEDCSFGNDNLSTGELRSLPAPGSTPGNGVNWFVAQATVADHFSEFFLTNSNAPLPVQLVAFATERKAETVQLTWRTASELNSAHFEVERSTDGVAFAKIGQVAAQGSKATTTDYTFLDSQPLSALTYYRLRQVDRDGTASYSPVRTVQLAASPTHHFTAFPVPARAGQLLTVAGLPAAATVEMLDALGRRVAAATATADGTAQLTLPQSLASGVYMLRSAGQAQRLILE